jgi:hypothetical protein
MDNKNIQIKQLVEDFVKVYERFYELQAQIEKEYEYWGEESNWKSKEDEIYSMGLFTIIDIIDNRTR